MSSKTKNILRWTGVVFSSLYFLGVVFESIMSGLIVILIILILIPKTHQKIKDLTKLKFSTVGWFFTVLALFITSSILLPEDSSKNDINTNPASEEKVLLKTQDIAGKDIEVSDTVIKEQDDEEDTTIEDKASLVPIVENGEEQSQYYKVERVVDGDTVVLNIGGKSETIRLIGIDTPETVHPSKPVECFGLEASNKAKGLLSNQEVILEVDPSQGEVDKYGRMLGYIILKDGRNFNELMIKEGYAYEYTYSSAYRYQKEFKEAETYASTNELGLWGPDACYEEPVVEPEPTPVSTGSNNYVCSSNYYNCTDFSSKFEAVAVYNACGGVNNDIHKLDGDSDGEPCESL